MDHCYIFDIDGTITDVEHRRHHVTGKPKRWDLFNAAMADDTPVKHIIWLLRTLTQAGVDIVLCTGREEVYREQTEAWLRKHDVWYDKLYMRPEKDYRTDDIIKAELLLKIREDGFNPIMAFDDRNSVVAMWRANGVPCAQVAEGNF